MRYDAGMDTTRGDSDTTHTGNSFRSFNPATGEAIGPAFHAAARDEVRLAGERAAEAMVANATKTREERARFLEACAANIAGLGESLVAQACEETGLAPARITTERDRTVMQLRMFAGIVREGSWVEAVIDHGDAARKPAPKPDVRRMLRPLGPVAVFGASNFPLAYSVGGGDTASALATGCSVVVKGHPAHPCTSELLATAMRRAVSECSFFDGTFSLLHAGGERDIAVGSELVMEPTIKAVGFTGSVGGGMALVKLAMQRPVPIPVFAEMGSVNPVVVLAGAVRDDAAGGEIAQKLAASALNSGGQMCTCPGLIFVIGASRENDAFVDAMAGAFDKAGEVTLLTARTRENLEKRRSEVAAVNGVMLKAGRAGGPTGAAVKVNATLFVTTGEVFRANPALWDECFGPSAIVVRCADERELETCLACLTGSLTGSLFAGPDDREQAWPAWARLEERVGRVIYNGVPTGVEVCSAMVHSGPYPSCSRPDSTAVGSAAMRRWCRPVCYQNVPEQLLPLELR